jgi:putative transposase
VERYRIAADASVYFVTFSVVEWLPVFVSETTCRIVCDSFRFCHEQKQLRINAFVIMPTHLHAIVFDANWNTDRLQQTLIDFRKFTGRQLTEWCVQHGPSCFASTLQSQATDDRAHRFWQPSRHPVSLITENFYQQKLDYLHEILVGKA